ncbi:MAG: polysaccharide biosynthesis C-terminal domain-containing protein, partial [Fusobacterium sp.]|nr:polysaccharide biosynthesis C-terminal domain-containing protein [Fusobacterium sp.]
IYLNIYLLSMLPMILYNIFSGIIRASGNSKITLYILAIGGFFNIIGNYFFIVFLELGVAGASISTLISQIITASLSIFYVIKSGLFSINNLKFSKFNSNILKTILYNGLPSGIQASIMTFSNIILQYFINTYGEDIIAAYITYFKVENFLWLPIVAIGQAVTTFVGQNYGAKNYERIKKGVVVATILSITIVLILIVIISSFPNTFFKIFIKDITVIRLGIDLLYFIFPFYWLYSILENFGAALRGIGHSLLSMTVGIITLSLTRILILIYLSKLNVGYKELAIIYPVTWSLTAISYSVLFFIYLKIKISEDFFLKEKIRIFTICSQILK